MLRNLLATVTGVAVLASATALAQSEFKTARNRGGDVDYVVTNYGIFGHDVEGSDPGFYYPRGTANPYIYGSGLWFGAKKQVNDTLRPLAFIGYNPNSGSSWATPGNASGPDDNRLYYAGDHDRSSGAYTGPGTGVTWPLWSRNGASATPRDPGVYVADVAARQPGGGLDRPAFMPNVEEQFVVRYHDGDLDRYEGFGSGFGFPIGLQIQQSVYSWGQFNNYESVVVLQYEVVNISDDTLHDCVIGQTTDPDLGQAMNDRASIYRGTNGKARAGVVTTGAESGRTYEALAEILIEAPSTGDDGFIDNTLRPARLAEHEIHTWRGWGIESDPITIAERYEFLLGPALDVDEGAGDQRTILASRPFSMLPGDTAHFAIAFAVTPSPFGMANDGDDDSHLFSAGPSSQSSLDDLIEALVADFADGAFSPSAPSAVERDESIAIGLSVAPNPAVATAGVSFSLSKSAPVEIVLLNALGERLSTTSLGHREAGTHRAALDLDGLAVGRYLVVVDADGVRSTTLLTVTR